MSNQSDADAELQRLRDIYAGSHVGMTLDDAVVIARSLVRIAQAKHEHHDAAALFKLIAVAEEPPMNLPTLTLAKSMAVAVINDDEAAALALADMLVNNPTRTEMNETAKTYHGKPMAYDGYEVYHWPEFQAFAKRLGILVDQYTVELTIMIPCRGVVKVIQSHHCVDASAEGGQTP